MLRYAVVPRKSPLSDEIKYYAHCTSPEPVTIDAIARRIAMNCTLTRHDIVACLSAFQEQLIESLQEGKSVRLSDLGSFRLTLRSKGCPKKEDFTSSMISGTLVRFVPAPKLRKALAVGAEGVQFVLQGKAPAEAAPGGDPVKG